MTPTPVRGTCALCGYRSTKAGLTRHLKTCPAAHDSEKGKPVRLYTLRAEDEYGGPWWLDLELKGSATLADLDGRLSLSLRWGRLRAPRTLFRGL